MAYRLRGAVVEGEPTCHYSWPSVRYHDSGKFREPCPSISWGTRSSSLLFLVLQLAELTCASCYRVWDAGSFCGTGWTCPWNCQAAGGDSGNLDYAHMLLSGQPWNLPACLFVYLGYASGRTSSWSCATSIWPTQFCLGSQTCRSLRLFVAVWFYVHYCFHPTRSHQRCSAAPKWS